MIMMECQEIEMQLSGRKVQTYAFYFFSNTSSLTAVNY